MDDDFILPEDVIEENNDGMDVDNDENEATVSTTEIHQERERNLTNKLSIEQCSEAMGDVLRKYKEVKKRIAELDNLAMQLSFGVRLQAEMDKCASERRNFPLHIELKRQRLSSGMSLLFVRLRNDSPFEMIDWHLTLTTSSYQMTSAAHEKDYRMFTKAIPIGRLAQYSEFTHEVFCTYKLPLPLIVRVQLIKCIHFTGNREPRAFRIALEPVYLTHWETITIIAAPESTTNRAVLYERADEEQKITLPDALVFLLCGEKHTEAALLKWIISTVTDECNQVNCVILDDENVRWTFSVQIKKTKLNYDVVLRMKNAKLRSMLIDELQLRILIHMRYVWKELKGKDDCEMLLDMNTLNGYFASFIAKYRR